VLVLHLPVFDLSFWNIYLIYIYLYVCMGGYSICFECMFVYLSYAPVTYLRAIFSLIVGIVNKDARVPTIGR
jgi:hypothetical protein